MAILHFINSKFQQTSKGMLFVLRYTMQDKKTIAPDGNKYVSGVNCTPLSAYTEFNNTKKLYGKTDGRLYYHFVQSFSADENISPQTAHEIALRFAVFPSSILLLYAIVRTFGFPPVAHKNSS